MRTYLERDIIQRTLFAVNFGNVFNGYGHLIELCTNLPKSKQYEKQGNALSPKASAIYF
jgi:hypothetical protein